MGRQEVRDLQVLPRRQGTSRLVLPLAMWIPGAREPVTQQGPPPACHPAEGVQGQGKTKGYLYTWDARQVLAK